MASARAAASARRDKLRSAVTSVVESLERRQMLTMAPAQIAINYAPWASEAEFGYLTDSGEVYGTQQFGFDYGWQSAITSGNTYERSASKPQKLETGVVTSTSNAWKIKLQPGVYVVKLVAGDANITSGTYKYNINGTTNFLNGTAGTGDARWVSATGEVTVGTDGTENGQAYGWLTITDNGGTQHRLAHVDIVRKDAKDAAGNPSAPTDVVATTRLSTWVDVRWVDNSAENFDDGFQIERKTIVNGSVTATSTITESGGIRQLYADYNRSASTTYEYRVRAVRTTTGGSVRYSDWSSPVQVTTPSNDNQSVYGPANWSIPTVNSTTGLIEPLQAEDYDKGGPGAAYGDSIGSNAGGFYRGGSVDVGLFIPENTYFVGWIDTNDWQEYTANIGTAGTYYVDAMVASNGTGGTWKLQQNGVDKITGIQVQDTGGWNEFEWQSSNTFSLSSGTGQVLRFWASAKDATGKFVGNFDSFRILRFDAPTSLTATAVSSGQVNLSWTSNATAPDVYWIERKEGSGGTWTHIASVAGANSTYSDTSGSLQAGSTYYYRVRARREMLGAATTTYDDTAYSNESNATLPNPTQAPTAPTGLIGTAGGTTVALSWTDTSSTETGFYVLRKLASESWPADPVPAYATVAANVTSYNDPNTSPATAYHYKVVAYNTAGRSADSNQVSVTTASSSVVTLNPTADTFVRDGTNASNSYGTQGTVEAKAGSGYTRQAFLKFDLTGISGTVNDAVLRVRGKLNSVDNVPIVAKEVADNTWTESINWSTKPTMGATIDQQTITGTSYAWHEFDLTPYIASAIAANQTTITVGLTGVSSTSAYLSFISREDPGNTGNKPQLVVTATAATPTVPTAPTALATGVVQVTSGGNSVSLSWSDNSSDETGFKVQRKQGAGAWATVHTNSAGDNAYVDTTVAEGQTYQYQVLATNAAGDSTASNELSIDLPLVAPSGVTIATNSASSLQLQWVDQSSVSDTFDIQYSTDAGFPADQRTVTLSEPATSASKLLTGLQPGTTYHVRIRAHASSGAVSEYVIATSRGTNPQLSVAIVGVPSSAAEGQSLSLTADVSNAPAGVELGYVWRLYKDGMLTATSRDSAFEASAGGDGLYQVKLRVTDGEFWAESIESLTVNDAPPSVVISGKNRAVEGTPYVLSLSATDPGGDAVTSWQIDWGDGVVETVGSVSSVTHTFESSTSGIVATAFQGSNSFASNERAVRVVPKAPTGLTAVRSGSQVNLEWEDASSVASQFVVERRIASASGDWAVLDAIQGGEQDSYADTTADTSLNYQYRVKAVGTLVESTYSNIATVSSGTTSSGTPIDLQIASLALTNDTGTAGDNASSDLRVEGTVTGTGDLGSLMVQFDVNGDGSYEGVAVTDQDGGFVFDLSDYTFAPGAMSVRVRAGRQDDVAGAIAFGTPSTFLFTYTPDTESGGDPAPLLPSARSNATYGSTVLIKPEIHEINGGAPTLFAGGWMLGGSFASFADRFNPTGGSSFSSSEQDTDTTPVTDSWSDSLGAYNSETEDTSSHAITSIVNPDGTWSYTETFESSVLVETWFAGSDNSEWYRQQSYVWDYTLTASGDAEQSSFDVDESRSNGVWFEWTSAAPSTNHSSDESYTSSASESYVFVADGNSLTENGVTATDESSLYTAGGSDESRSSWKDSVSAWINDDKRDGAWTYVVARGIDGSSAGQDLTDNFSYSETRHHTYDNKEGYDYDNTSTSGGITRREYGVGETYLTGKVTDVYGVDGFYISPASGQSSSKTRVYHTEKSSYDTLTDTGSDTIETKDTSTPGVTVNSSSTATKSTTRNRSIDNENDATTYRLGGVMYAFDRETDGLLTTSTGWDTSRTSTSSGSDNYNPNDTSSFESSRNFTDIGSSLYTNSSTGEHEIDANGEVSISGSTTITSSMDGDTTWNNSDSSERETIGGLASSAAVSTNSETVTSDSTDIGNGEYHAYTKIWSTSDSANGVQQFSETNNWSKSSGDTTDNTVAATKSFRREYLDGEYLIRETSLDSSREERPTGSYTIDASLVADASPDSSTWTDSYLKTDTGSVSSKYTEKSTNALLDTRADVATENSYSETNYSSTQYGGSEGSQSATTYFDNGDTRWTRSASQSVDGPTSSSIVTDTNKTKVPAPETGLTESEITTTHYEKHFTGTGENSSSERSEGDASGSQAWQESTSSDNGSYTTKSNARTDYSYAQFFTVDSETGKAELTKYKDWYTLETSDGNGIYGTSAKSTSSSDSSGSYTANSKSLSTSSDSGTHESWADSKAYISGVEHKTGLTSTFGDGEGFNEDRYYEHRKGGFTSKTIDSNWSSSNAGSYDAGSTAYAESKKSGASDWVRIENTAVAKIDTTVANLKRTSDTTTVRNDSGTGSYSNESITNATDGYEEVPTRVSSGFDKHSGTWIVDTTINTAATYEDKRESATLGKTATGSNVAHQSDDGSGTFYVEQTFTDTLNSDGTVTAKRGNKSGNTSDVASTYDTYDDRWIVQDFTKQEGNYSYEDANGNSASEPITVDTEASWKTRVSREGGGNEHRESHTSRNEVDGQLVDASVEVYNSSTGTFTGWDDSTKNAKVIKTSSLLSETSVGYDYTYTKQTDGSYSTGDDYTETTDSNGKVRSTSTVFVNQESDTESNSLRTNDTTSNRTLSLKTNSTVHVETASSEDKTDVTNGFFESKVYDKNERFIDDTTTSYHTDERFESGDTAGSSETVNKQTAAQNSLDVQGNVAFKNKSSTDQSSALTRTGGKFTSWEWNEVTIDADEDKTVNGESKDTASYNYTFTSKDHSNSRKYVLGSAGAPDGEQSGIPLDRDEYITNERKRDVVAGTGSYTTNSNLTVTAGVANGKTITTDTSSATYSDDTTTVHKVTEDDNTISVVINGVTHAGKRNGSFQSDDTSNADGTLTNTISDETYIVNDVVNHKNVVTSKDVGNSTWESNQTTIYNEKGSLLGTSAAGNYESATNNVSESSGADNYNLNTVTTTHLTDGKTISVNTSDTGSGGGSSGWDNSTNQTFKGNVGNDYIDNVDRSTDEGSGDYTFTNNLHSGWFFDEDDVEIAYTNGKSTRTIDDVQGDYSSYSQRANDVPETSTYSGSTKITRFNGKTITNEVTDGHYTTNGSVTVTFDNDTSEASYSGSVTSSNTSTDLARDWQHVRETRSTPSHHTMNGKAFDYTDFVEIKDSKGSTTGKTGTVTATAVLGADGKATTSVDATTAKEWKSTDLSTASVHTYTMLYVPVGGTENDARLLPVTDESSAYSYRGEYGPIYFGTEDFLEESSTWKSTGKWARWSNNPPSDFGDMTVTQHENWFRKKSLSDDGTTEYLQIRQDKGSTHTSVDSDTERLRFKQQFDFTFERPAGSYTEFPAVKSFSGYDTTYTDTISDDPWNAKDTYVLQGQEDEIYEWHVDSDNPTPTFWFSGYYVQDFQYRATDYQPLGIYRGLNYDFKSAVYNWLWDETGVDAQALEDKAVETVEIAADTALGFVDGVVDAVNPLSAFNLNVPDLGPVFGHDDAYFYGNVAGTVAGVAGSFLIGNVASGTSGLVSCSNILVKGAKLYTALDTGIGVAAAGYNITTTGKIGLGDVLGLAPAVGYLGGKVGAKLGILSEQCFIAGTDVLVGDAEGLFSEKNIEDIRVGDLVWSKDENDPNAPLELKRVTNVFQHVAHDLQKVSLQGQDGNVEVIHSTDEHPYFVEAKGWVGAADLVVGDRVRQSDGSSLLVIANADDKRPEGVLVFNFAVEGNHTYFVEDGAGENDWAWVHNRCAGYHHLYTRGFGSKLPHGHASLPYLSSKQHTRVHELFSGFLEAKTGFRYGSMSGAEWRSFRSEKWRKAATKEFYRKLDGTREGRELAALIAKRNKLPPGTSFSDMLVDQLKAERGL